MTTIKKKPSPTQRKKNGTVAKTVSSIMKSADRASNKVHWRQELGQQNPRAGLGTYRNAVINPFFAPQTRLGWGCYTPTSLLTGWTTFSPAMNVNGTAFAVLFQPNLTGTIATTCVSYSSLLSNTTLATAPTTSNNNFVNGTSLATLADSSRIISAAMRIAVRSPDTAMRGTLGAVFLPYSTYTGITGLTYDAIRSLPSYREFSVSAIGSGGEVQYRPCDPSDFTFTVGHTAGVSVGSPQVFLAIVGTGWPAANHAIDISAIAHHESLGGLDAAAMDAIGNTLADHGITMDQAARSLMTEAPIIPSLSLLDSIENGLSHITKQFPAFSGDFGGRLGVAESSSSSSSTAKKLRAPYLATADHTSDEEEVVVSLGRHSKR